MKGTPILDARWLSALGVLSAGVLLSEVNIYSARHHTRWDVSSDDRYTLSEASRRLVEKARRPLELILIEGAQSSVSVELRQMLKSYDALGSNVRVSTLNPDRNPAKLLALLESLDAEANTLTADFASDAALFVQSGTRTWLIRRSRLTAVDSEGRPLSSIESSVTEAIAQVLHEEKRSLCFVVGHGERSIDDESDEGLSELRRLLLKSNFDVKRAPMDVPDPKQSLQDCDGFVLIGPDRPLPKEHTALLARASDDSLGFLALVDPIIDQNARVLAPELADLSKTFGADVVPAFVLEQDPTKKMLGSMGEVFFAETKVHPLTQGLTTQESRMDQRVVVTAASPVRLTPESTAKVVLTTSDQAIPMVDLKNRETLDTLAGSQKLAVANEAAVGAPKRTVLVGSSSPVTNASFRDPSQSGNRVFAENLFGWTFARETLISVPSRPLMSAGLSLSEDSLSSLFRYVLIYIPLAAVSLGAAVLFRRWQREQRSRESQEGGGT